MPILSPNADKSLYRLHAEKWSKCRDCPLWLVRNKVVLCRGQIPCDVLFIGEAPGQSENVIGLPFVGPAGQLMDQTVERALLPWQIPGTRGPKYNTITSAFSNLVACIPLDDKGIKTEEPPDESIRTCAPRLIELTEIASPKLIVCVGNLARDFLDTKYLHSVKISRSIPQVSVIHPAAVLRSPWAARDLQIKKSVVTIRDAVAKHILPIPEE